MGSTGSDDNDVILRQRISIFDLLRDIMRLQHEEHEEEEARNDRIYQQVLDESFEEDRKHKLDSTFDETHNWKLHFDTNIAEVNEENKLCMLCCDGTTDYVCSKCGYPMCTQCITHLKHSTNKCPQCGIAPIILQPVKNSNRTLELNNDGEEMPTDNA